MKKIKTYEDFVNEEINWRKALLGATIVTGLSLSSCDTKTELESKKPQIENLVINDINDRNKRMPEDMAMEFNEIDSINGPIKTNEYYIDSDSSKVMMGTFINTYLILSKIHREGQRYWYLSTYYESNENSSSKENVCWGREYENYSEALNAIKDYIKGYKEDGSELQSSGPAVTRWKSKNGKL
jgi:hypothetical protein